MDTDSAILLIERELSRDLMREGLEDRYEEVMNFLFGEDGATSFGKFKIEGSVTAMNLIPTK